MPPRLEPIKEEITTDVSTWDFLLNSPVSWLNDEFTDESSNTRERRRIET